jgi:hypothetical protein
MSFLLDLLLDGFLGLVPDSHRGRVTVGTLTALAAGALEVWIIKTSSYPLSDLMWTAGLFAAAILFGSAGALVSSLL